MERILIYRLGSMGDILVSLPCFRYIKNKFNNAEIMVLTNNSILEKATPIEKILENENLFSKVMKYNIGTRRFKDLILIWKILYSYRFDHLFFLLAERGNFSELRDFIFFKICRIKKIHGIRVFSRERIRPIISKVNLLEREVVRLLKNIGAQDSVDIRDNYWWRLNLTKEEISEARNVLIKNNIVSNYIVLCPGTKQEIKDWTINNWISLVQLLNKYKLKYSIVFVGSKDESERCEMLLSYWEGKGANLAGMLEPRISAAIIKESILFVGHDSGPMHLAASVQTPIFAIFSSRNLPVEWFPFGDNSTIFYNHVECMGCYLNKCEKFGKKCILSISPADVFLAIENKLNEKRL